MTLKKRKQAQDDNLGTNNLSWSRPLRFMVFFISLLGLSVITACSSSPTTQDKSSSADSQATPNDTSAVQGQPKIQTELDLDAQSMYQILAAEMLLKRDKPQAAFDIFYDLALQKENAELAQRAFQIAMATYQIENISQATQLWRDLAPDEALAWRASVSLSLREPNLQQAIDEWQTYQKLSPSNFSKDVLTTASRLSATVPLEQAFAFFKELAQLHPEAWSVHYALAVMAENAQQPQIGLVALDAALNTLPATEKENFEAIFYRLLAKFYLQAEQFETGVKQILPALQRYPDDQVLQERMARLEVRSGRYSAAEKRYETLLEKAPEANRSRFSLALLKLEKQAYREAEHLFDALTQVAEYRAAAYYYLGIMWQRQDNFEQAADAFQYVAPDDAYYVDAQLRLSEIYYAQNQLKNAIKTLDGITAQTNEDQIKVLRAKAIYSGLSQDTSAAIALYDEVLEKNPNNVDVLKAQSVLFYETEQFDRYENNLVQILELNAEDVDSLNALGYYYVENKTNFEQAQRLIRKALQLEPESFYILDSLGWYYYQTENFAEAVNYLQTAFAKQKDAEVLAHLIQALWSSGNEQKALALWEKHRQDFPENEALQQLMQKLK